MNLLTVMETAAKLKVGKSTVYNILQSGELPAVRIRSAWRIREHDVEAYVERHLTGGGTDAQEKA